MYPQIHLIGIIVHHFPYENSHRQRYTPFSDTPIWLIHVDTSSSLFKYCDEVSAFIDWNYFLCTPISIFQSSVLRHGGVSTNWYRSQESEFRAKLGYLMIFTWISYALIRILIWIYMRKHLDFSLDFPAHMAWWFLMFVATFSGVCQANMWVQLDISQYNWREARKVALMTDRWFRILVKPTISCGMNSPSHFWTGSGSTTN